MKKILFIFGTRPEAIKMAPLVKEFQKHSDRYRIKTCVTGQHRELLDQVLNFFEIKPDYDLNIMKPNQSLYTITANVLLELEKILKEFKPDNIWVQGDTTTVMAGSIAAFYAGITISHLEAGLRSGDKHSPFPEEINRKITGHIADYHFAPTDRAVKSLNSEGITNNIWQVGNTVIDALLLGLKIIKNQGEDKFFQFFKDINFSKRIILITGHRRESFGQPFINMCEAIKDIAAKHPEVQLVYPVHLNPNVQKTVNVILSDLSNVHLFAPLSYSYLIWLMNKSYLVLTDSGGIQEEAPSLGKPVLVMRDVTERLEGIEAGTAKLVGTNKHTIIEETQKLLEDNDYYQKMANAVNPYGDGTTCKKIVEIYNNEILI